MAQQSSSGGSTFPGPLEEIEGVSIDNFSEDNHNSSIFFLSHYHGDHMNYLFQTIKIHKLFNKANVRLYASEITVALLKNEYGDVQNFVALQMGVMHPLTVPTTGKQFHVTLIPARHCAGSVMFLFETDKTVLYTGDIRLTVKDIKATEVLHDQLGKVKKIDKIYLDTTFFSEEYCSFPSCEESLDALLRWIPSRLVNPNHCIKLELPAIIGSECLLSGIRQKLKMPIHVSERMFKIYGCIPEMDNVVTLDPSKTRIHSSCNPDGAFNNHCDNVESSEAHIIKFSITRWRNRNFANGLIEERGQMNYLAYSTHCSCDELVNILLYLRPLDVYCCVLPENLTEQNKMYELCNKVLNAINNNNNN